MAKAGETAKEWRQRYWRLLAQILPGGPAAAAEQMARNEEFAACPRTIATRQPARERARRALDRLPAAKPASNSELVKQVNDLLHNNGEPRVSPAAIMRASGRWPSKKFVSSATPAKPQQDQSIVERAKFYIDGGFDFIARPAPSQGGRKFKIARRALASLFPQGIPDAPSKPNKLLVRDVVKWIEDNKLRQSVGPDTILRAAGRK